MKLSIALNAGHSLKGIEAGEQHKLPAKLEQISHHRQNDFVLLSSTRKTERKKIGLMNSVYCYFMNLEREAFIIVFKVEYCSFVHILLC